VVKHNNILLAPAYVIKPGEIDVLVTTLAAVVTDFFERLADQTASTAGQRTTCQEAW
jgi:deoxyhypusine synthase